MASAKASLDFVGIGCNRVSQAADAAADGLVAFAANHFVALYRPEAATSHGTISTLRGHRDRVNCLKYLRRGSGSGQRDVGLVSGSADKTLRIWKKIGDDQWICSAVLEGHTAGITSIGVVRGRNIPGDLDLIASAASDGTIRIWERLEGNEDIVRCVQVLSVGARYAMCLALAYLPNSTVPVLISGGTDSRMTVYIRERKQFAKALELQGHSDWIRSLDIATYTSADDDDRQQPHFRDGDLMLASASQDKYIRIWKISDAAGDVATNGDVDDFTNQMMNALADAGLEDGGFQLSTKAHLIEVEDINDSLISKRKYTIMFDALLMGHDDWVHSAAWQAPLIGVEASNSYHQPMALVSASADKSIMIWRPDPISGTWINEVRLGEIGGSTLGFYGSLFSPNGNWVLANGYNGALHVWSQASENEWTPRIGISGHFKSVEDLSWDPSGQFFVSTSLDQTTRLFAPWKRDTATTWHEVARPQIHGYDLHCLAFVHKYQFVSGADEKVLRVFEAPRTFVQSLQGLTQETEQPTSIEQLPIGASVPALGLSNKAVFEGDMKTAEASHDFRNLSAYTAVASTPTSLLEALTQPPFEQHLLQHTLWPETNKLYGHGYEIISVAASHDGNFVASACKAAKAEHAAIRLWSTKTWKEVCAPLAAHNLTVAGIRFSPDDRYILTVGRDRAWALFQRTDDLQSYSPVAFQAKAHMRIIWDGAWSHDVRFFATGSRDKTVKIWAKQFDGTSWKALTTLKFGEGVTAVDFAPRLIANSYILAAGLEDGRIQVFQLSLEDNNASWTESVSIPLDDCHAGPVKSVAWRTRRIQADERSSTSTEVLQLATCSEDHSVRLFSVPFSTA
ncbi:Elongator subunit ELP2 [Spizellomyces punctatus DAOM BR117]|uniref:Elongator complex protein 2 n=1 Tax=Spizellomyces punctatus (strain DAOM BR117) TaxID=645134 RepID=A0A0L0HUJ0_SPIPD|nr:Elongator subunit ELP2 [Spizellomyces punctatus DAOM BR117]KND04539.1 hypothetical protein SPPG_00264 [Spizellomyces punctatus DAOM BR117]|eukprot:XP_016612578.1 hypothetical protein SPPG_00264 [Spizellomyces punctatus DAOM BR117]